jgi:hypothetical protein
MPAVSGPESAKDRQGPTGGAGAAPRFELPDSSAPPQNTNPGGRAVVYAHSSSHLYQIDPDNLALTTVGRFGVRQSDGQRTDLLGLTDLAVDRDGRIVGVTASQVFQIEGTTADCVPLARLPEQRQFNGLSWVRSPDGPERLIATDVEGEVYRIDPATGAATAVGALGGGLASSGDLVSVAQYGTLLTVTGNGSDRLSRVDPFTGAATVIGSVGYTGVWGLGFWGNQVFGFTEAGEFLLINPRTGAGRIVRRVPDVHFWGAGVTTSAPVVVE